MAPQIGLLGRSNSLSTETNVQNLWLVLFTGPSAMLLMQWLYGTGVCIVWSILCKISCFQLQHLGSRDHQWSEK